jgi:hypothetical protein
MNKDRVAGLGPACAQAGRALADAVLELGVVQALALALERLPNEKGMIGAGHRA